MLNLATDPALVPYFDDFEEFWATPRPHRTVEIALRHFYADENRRAPHGVLTRLCRTADAFVAAYLGHRDAAWHPCPTRRPQ